MRAFVSLRRSLAASPSLASRMRRVEETLAAHGATLGEHGQAIKEVFADIRRLMEPARIDKPRRRRTPRKNAKHVEIVATVRA